MSHVATIDLNITDLDALQTAADELGMELVRDATTFKWYGQWVNDWHDPARAAAVLGFDPKTFGTCEHKLRFKQNADGAYEVGLVKHPDGRPGWVPIYDAYSTNGKRIENALGGTNLSALRQGYAKTVARKHLTKMGYRTRVTTTADGRVQVHATR